MPIYKATFPSLMCILVLPLRCRCTALGDVGNVDQGRLPQQEGKPLDFLSFTIFIPGVGNSSSILRPWSWQPCSKEVGAEKSKEPGCLFTWESTILALDCFPLFNHLLWETVPLYVHELLPLAVGYEQLSIVTPDRGGVFRSDEEASAVYNCFSSGSHSIFSNIFFPSWLLFTIISMCIFWILSLPSVVPSYCKPFTQAWE